MSWVMRMTATPVRRWRSRNSARICACTVTSSAVVGSSAIRSLGRPASAIAIITRWRCPPESSCGYCRSRRAGSGIRTSASSSSARAPGSASGSCARIASPSCVPIRITGFSDVIGSWKIIAISPPR